MSAFKTSTVMMALTMSAAELHTFSYAESPNVSQSKAETADALELSQSDGHAYTTISNCTSASIKPNENSSKKSLSFSSRVAGDVKPAVHVMAVDGRSESENYSLFDPTLQVQYDDRIIFILGINLLQIEIGGLA